MVCAYIKRDDMLNALNVVIKAAEDDYRNAKSFGERCEALILEEAVHLIYGYMFKLDFEFFNTDERIDTDER